MVHITLEEKNIIEKIFCQHLPSCAVIAFGSRVRGDHHPFSDLDLAIQNKEGKVNSFDLAQVVVALKESSLPYSVDSVDLETTSPLFKSHILQTGENLFQFF